MLPTRSSFTVTVLTAAVLVGCDPGAKDYDQCVKLEAKDPEAALASCESAVTKAADNDSGKAAKAKIPGLQAAITELEKQRAEEAAKKAARAKKKRIAKAKKEMERWKAMPATLIKKIRKQGMWDMGRGTATSVMDVITGEIGDPIKSYEGGYGMFHIHVWGADPGSEPSTEEIRKTPFNVRMLRGLVCGDYSSAKLEFYSNGERIW